jgi:8-hydroxy-5-deazaflavin:NADPH oxidoreductase
MSTTNSIINQNILILGTGAVGQALAGKLLSLGHQVNIGTRNVKESLSRTEKDNWGNSGIGLWIKENPTANLINFDDIGRGFDLIINALSGQAVLSVLSGISTEVLDNKIMIDISNPLDFSKGFPPSLSICNDTSLGEQIQAEFPFLKIVKALNTISNPIMVNPKLLEGDHTVFVSGNEADAKSFVSLMLKSFGWEESQIFDLGDITTCRGTEMFLPLWVRMFGKLGSPIFNINVNSKSK